MRPAMHLKRLFWQILERLNSFYARRRISGAKVLFILLIGTLAALFFMRTFNQQEHDHKKSASKARLVKFPVIKTNRTTWTPAQNSSTTHYLDSFSSIFIVEPLNHQPQSGSKQNASQMVLRDAPSESKALPVQNKLIVWYNNPSWITKEPDAKVFGHCPVSTCSMSMNYKEDGAKADAVVFFDAPVKKPVPRRTSADQVYVFYMIEPPSIALSEYRNTVWNSAFNWTLTYRLDADVWIPYLFLKRSKQLPSREFLRELVRKKEMTAAWFVTNCKREQSRRTEYVERLQKVFPVDVYGKCGTLECPRMSSECDVMLSTRYYFYLSFENSFCQDYVTEKFTRAFFDGVYVVPVVRGGLNYTHHFPEGTFIDADAYSSPEELGQYLKQLMSDEEKYVDMLWRIAHFTAYDNVARHYWTWCQFCSKLHRLQDNVKTYPDLFQWYHEAKCWPPRHF